MKILVFAPHAQIWKHAFPEAVLVESLMKSGHEIIYVKCSGAFKKHCIPMISSHIAHDAEIEIKSKICQECKANSKLIVDSFKFPSIELDVFIDLVDQNKIENIVKNTTRENFSSLELDGVKIGEIALYQVLLRYKQSKTNDFSEKAWQEYLKQLHVTLVAFWSLKKIIQTHRPDRIIQYSGLYSVNSVCRQLSQINNIPTYFLHAGINQRDRLRHLIVAKSQTFDYIKSLFMSWEVKYKEKTCLPEAIIQVTDNFIDILKSKSFLSYSQSKSESFDIRKKFNIPQGKRVIVAIMSSYDEHLAADAVGAYQHQIKPLFNTQIEWVRTLIDFFSKRQDLFLVIRLHPREFPTKREKHSAVMSQHAKDVEFEFRKLPDNVVINWPSDLISFYDLIEETELFLNAFSTSAREITMLGLPALTYNNEDVLEPVSINYKGNSIEEYLKQIDIFLEKRFDIERIRKAYRWRALEQIYSHISIAESYNEKDDLLSFPEKVFKKLDRTINKSFPLRRQKIDIKKRAKTLEAAVTIDALLSSDSGNVSNVILINPAQLIDKDEEIDLIRREIKRLMTYLYPDTNKPIKSGSLRSYLVSFVNSNIYGQNN